MSTAPSTPPTKPKWGRLGTVVRRTSNKFTKSGKPSSDGDSDAGSLRQTPSLELIPNAPSHNSSPSASPTPPSKSSKIGRIGRAVRRASTKLTVSRHGTPSTERDSDSRSLKRTESREVLPSTTPSLSVIPQSIEATMPSPIAESPVREAEAIQREVAGPSSLSQLFLSSPESEELQLTPQNPAAPHAVIEDHTLLAVEELTSSPNIEAPSEDAKDVVHGAEPDASLVIVPLPADNGLHTEAHPTIDLDVDQQAAESLSTPADDESLVIVDSSIVDIGALITEFNASAQDGVLPGALPLTPNPLFGTNVPYDHAERDVEAGQQDTSSTDGDTSAHPEMMASLFLPIDPPMTFQAVQSLIAEASRQILTAIVDADAATIPDQQTSIEQPTEDTTRQPDAHPAPSSLPNIDVPSDLPPFPPNFNHDAPTSEKDEKAALADHYAAASTSVISQPPPAYTVDHFPSPVPNAHLAADPEKAASTSRPQQKDQPSLKSALKRPNSTISTTNNTIDDFRFKTLVAVVGAMASIVATAMLFLRR